MRCCSPPTFACCLLESLLPDPYREAVLGDLIEEYTLRVESTSRLTASRWFWSQTFRSAPSMVWSSLRSGNCFVNITIAMGRVHLHGNTEVCCGLDDVEVVHRKSSDVCRSCADCVSRDNRNRWLRRCTNPPGRNDLSCTDRNDHGCHFDRRKGLQHTGAVVVSVWISHTRSPGGDHLADTSWTLKATRSCSVGTGSGPLDLVADSGFATER